MSFNPDEPRDAHGRWGGGDAGGHAGVVPSRNAAIAAHLAAHEARLQSSAAAVLGHTRRMKQRGLDAAILRMVGGGP